MNIFWHELKANRKSLIIWSLSLVVLTLFFLSLYPSFHQNAEDSKKLLMGFPPQVRQALGISIDMMTSFIGFYAYFFLYGLLCGSIQAMNLGLSILGNERREKTSEFLLTKPISRENIVSSKLLAAVATLVITNIVFIICANIIARIFSSGYDITVFNKISVTLLFVQLIFLAIGLFVSVIFNKIKSVIGVSMGIVFTFFIVNMLASTTGLESLRYLTPFQYFETSYIIKNSSYEHTYIITEMIGIIIAITASYIIYKNRDIESV